MDPVRKYVVDLQRTLELLPLEQVHKVIDELHEARLRQRQVFIMGNGGSASTATHFVCDLGKNTRREGRCPALKVSSRRGAAPTVLDGGQFCWFSQQSLFYLKSP
jgi:phosphoheptose isomerase